MKFGKLVTAAMLMLTFLALNNFQQELERKLVDSITHSSSHLVDAISFALNVEKESTPQKKIKELPTCTRADISFKTTIEKIRCRAIIEIKANG